MKHRIINLLALVAGYHFNGLARLANIAAGTHEDSVTKLADAALTTRNLVVKVGSDEDHVAVCGASDDPCGICTDEPSAAEREANVAFLGATNKSRLVVGSEVIAVGARAYTAASGKVQNLPAVAGTYYCIGRAVLACAADGDEFEIEPCFPLAVIVT